MECIERSLITHISTLYYSLPDHLCFDRLWSEIYTSILTSNQKPALLNLWILLVIMLICVHVVQRCQPQMCNLRPSSNDSEAVRQQCHHSGTVQSREIQRHYRVIIQPIRSNHYLQHTNQQKETRKQQHSTNQKKRWNSTNHWQRTPGRSTLCILHKESKLIRFQHCWWECHGDFCIWNSAWWYCC